MRVSAFGAAFVTAFAVGYAGAEEPAASVTGRVVDAAGNGVGDAEVLMRIRAADGKVVLPATAEADGGFRGPSVPNGWVTLCARADDGRVGFAWGNHTTDRPAVFDIVTSPPTPPLRLRVLDPEGKPIGGAVPFSVTFPGSHGETVLTRDLADAFAFAWGESDEAGLIEIGGLPLLGLATVELAHPSFARGRAEKVEAGGDPTDVRLVRPGRLRLHFEGKGIRVPAELELTVTHAGDSETYLYEEAIRPDTAGRCEVPVPPGAYRGLVRAKNVQTLPDYFQEISVPEGGTGEVRLSVTSRGIVRGSVLRQGSGEPAADVWVSAAVYSDRFQTDDDLFGANWHHSAHAKTGPDGRFEITPGVGRVRLYVNRRGVFTEPAAVEVNVPVGLPVDAEPFRLVPPPRVTGTVIGPDGAPVSNAVLKPSGELWGFTSGVADESGRFDFPVEYYEQPDRTKAVGSIWFRVFDPRRPLATDVTVPIDLSVAPDARTIRLEPWRIGAPPGTNPTRNAAEWTSVGPGDEAPELVARRVVGGGPVRLADLRGRFVLLDFWTVWCGPCRAHKPEVEAAARLYGDRLAVVGVHDNSVDPEAVAAEVAENGPVFPTVIDTADNTTVRRYGVNAYPSYVLIDPAGRVVLTDAHNGSALRADLLLTIRAFLYGSVPEPVEAARP